MYYSQSPQCAQSKMKMVGQSGLMHSVVDTAFPIPPPPLFIYDLTISTTYTTQNAESYTGGDTRFCLSSFQPTTDSIGSNTLNPTYSNVECPSNQPNKVESVRHCMQQRLSTTLFYSSFKHTCTLNAHEQITFQLLGTKTTQTHIESVCDGLLTRFFARQQIFYSTSTNTDAIKGSQMPFKSDDLPMI